MSSDYQWVATELRTGELIAELPELDVGSITKSLGKFTTTTASLPLARAPENWRRATLQGATVLNCLDKKADPQVGVPIWSGFITRRPRQGTGKLELSLATVDAYFDRRYVGDRSYNNVDQNSIVTDLVASFAATGSNGGIPIRVEVVTAGAGKVRVRNYKDMSDKTLYSALTELMGVDGGPEWAVFTEWQHNPERLTFVLRVGDRIGSAAADGLDPNVQFDLPGSLAEFELMEDYSADNAGNDFMAVSTAIGDTRPQSEHILVTDPDRPTFERRFTPSSSIVDVNTLNDHARKKATLQGGGTNTLTMVSISKGVDRVGVTWDVGDDVGVQIADTVPDFPDGFSAAVRATGWQIDFGRSIDKVTPVLEGVSTED
ncbi:hypothetical protein LLS1_18400 [Leifsonia sp. LS1]|uniref:hypothetical protein n=1 Tax=Leifsonia sp. LS1 TaxID=2828483 RepID=UPI001CFCC81C|nr:hypothetical protein [Leifsonia sp. LS1]GIT80171.1 hypothetical protein LLS1_18400 [Leifsonia sp. LS1]